MKRSAAGPVLDAADLLVGQVIPVGPLTLTVAEIVDFARRYDPQPFHLDEAAARRSIFGGLVAAGFHTLAACFGLQVREGVLTRCNLGGRGIAALTWSRAVRPGAPHALELEVRRITPEPAKGRAEVAMGYVLRDEEGRAAMDATILHLLRWTGVGEGCSATREGAAPS